MNSIKTTPRIAIVHDWLIERGGAERTLLRLHALWPSAPIYTLLAKQSFVERWLPDAFMRVSALNRIPFASHILPLLAPLFPSAIESMDLSAYDVIISSSVTFSKGVISRTRTKHISYCYSPTRMLWDRHGSYERQGIFSRLFRHALRLWDYQAAQRPDALIAISQEVQCRIKKYYHRDSVIIHPPIEVREDIPVTPGESYLVVGRLVPHKNIDIVLEAFAKLGRPLTIVGSGPMERSLRRTASPNVSFVTDADDTVLAQYYASAKAVIVPNEEDFGMTAVEALAYGKPVLALRAGGVLDILEEGVTGEFFDDPIPEALAEGILRLERGTYDPDMMKKKAEPFRAEYFDRALQEAIHEYA